ncbi:unnamed protein product [Rangifer tarandus platyrhynchus]|uniref:Uncharacterized protein n=1 Tax=Rangifer tarandus platyrhynchus TaxID=3082113 RepID=A0AC60A6X1_RANTA
MRFPRPAARRTLRPGCVSGAGRGRESARGESRGGRAAAPGGVSSSLCREAARRPARRGPPCPPRAPRVSDPRKTERCWGDAAASSLESWPGRGAGRPGGRARGPRRP